MKSLAIFLTTKPIGHSLGKSPKELTSGASMSVQIGLGTPPADGPADGWKKLLKRLPLVGKGVDVITWVVCRPKLYTENWSLETTGSSSSLSRGNQVGKPLRIHLGFGQCSSNAMLLSTGGSSVFSAMNVSVSPALLQGGEIDQTRIGGAHYHYLRLPVGTNGCLEPRDNAKWVTFYRIFVQETAWNFLHSPCPLYCLGQT